jgi:hypothetical protein
MHQHGGQHTPQADGAARAQLSKLFFARLDEKGGARPVTGGVCYCCKTALATGPAGSIYAAWRHVYPGNRRDIAFAMSKDGGRTFSGPLRISEDDWQLDGCPENGPALAVDAAGRIHVVWPTLINESGQETLALFYATSNDGRTFSRRVRIASEGPAYHPQLIAAGGELLVAWDDLVGGKRRVRVARGTPGSDRRMAFHPAAVPASSDGSYATLASTANGTVVAWTTPGPESRIAVARLSFGAQR